jgi:hypothetical protein
MGCTCWLHRTATVPGVLVVVARMQALVLVLVLLLLRIQQGRSLLAQLSQLARLPYTMLVMVRGAARPPPQWQHEPRSSRWWCEME